MAPYDEEDFTIEGWDDVDPALRMHLERLADEACDRDDMREGAQS